MAAAEHSNADPVRERVVAFFRHELEHRYRLTELGENEEIRREDLLDGLTQQDLDRIKDFFLDVMYPPPEERQRWDQALKTLGDMLTDPGNLVSLFPSVPRIALRYGMVFPEALRAGRDVLRAYHTSTELEAELVAQIRAERPGAEASEIEAMTAEQLRGAYAGVSLDKARRLVGEVRRVVEHGKRRRLMEATREILSELKRHSRSERRSQAVAYVVSVVTQVEEIAEQYREDQIEKLVRIAEIVENDYLDQVAGIFP